MSNLTIRLPRVVVTELAAIQLVQESFHDETILINEKVTVFARAVSTSSSSFSDGLIRELYNLGVKEIMVKGYSNNLKEQLTNSVKRYPDVEISF